jgi:hypothetical protein
MTARKPLVIVSGLQQELPAADIIAPGATLTTTQRDALVTPATGQFIFNSTTGQPEYYDGTQWYNFAGEPSLSTGQIKGFTPGNIAEVEATKALRVSLRAPDVFSNMFARSQFAFSSDAIVQNATTLAGVNQSFFVFMWTSAGIAIFRKVTINIWTSALSGTRAGSISASLFRSTSMSSLGSTASQFLPDSQSLNVPTAGRYTQGLIANQPISLMNYGAGANSGTATATQLDTNPMGTVYGEAKNAIGTNLMNATLWEAKPGEAPLILSRFAGFYVLISYPAAATSQTIQAQLNARWDEVVPITFSDMAPQL